MVFVVFCGDESSSTWKHSHAIHTSTVPLDCRLVCGECGLVAEDQFISLER